MRDIPRHLHAAGGDVTFLPGVNLGSTTPGHQPGELSITAVQYRSWFSAMAWVGIRVVRVYTIHPPAFYRELAAYNARHPDRPLYLMQGIYLPDESYVQKQNIDDQFASYHAYPYYPDFQRHEPGLQAFRYAGRPDPYAGYLAALRSHHGDIPTLVTEFGVPSALGSAHNGPLGRSQGDHSEQDAMAIDASLLRLIKDQGLAGGFLNEQNFGLVATDPAGSPEARTEHLLDDEHGWPVRRVTAGVDESYVRLRIGLGQSLPRALTLGFDVLPALTGPPAPGSADRQADAAFTLDLVAHTGQAYSRQQLDRMPLDYRMPAAARGAAPAGWRRLELIVNRDLTIPTTGERLPAELQNVGALRYGSPEQDSRALWQIDGNDLVVRVPWGMLGYADPSAHSIGVPRTDGTGAATLTTQVTETS